MKLPRTVADVLTDHVVLEIECIDRMYLNLYIPQLQRPLGVAAFVQQHLGMPIASTAALAPMTEEFYKRIRRFAAVNQVPIVDFKSGERKDDIMRARLADFLASGRSRGVVFIGRAQEKTRVFATVKKRRDDGSSYPWIDTTSRVINAWYFYCYDADTVGPFFLKYAGYFPYTARLCVNGNEYAKVQAMRAGVDFTPLDNGFAAAEDPSAIQAICDSFDEQVIEKVARTWMARLPSPWLPRDAAAGFSYDISILQAEFSLTQVLAKPVHGRIFFEQVIRDNLDLGRPDKVAFTFDRAVRTSGAHPTRSRWRTRVLTAGVTPTLHVDYKNNKIKQYHKEEIALRTETTINNPRDFKIGKRLCNLPLLRKVGFDANRRLLRAQQISHDPINGYEALHHLIDPVTTPTGTRTAGLRFGHERTDALLSALCTFTAYVHGFRAGDLREQLAPRLGLNPQDLTTGRLSYDLRRLRTHQLIDRIPGTHRYQITETGLHLARFYTLLTGGILYYGLSQILDIDPPNSSPLRRAARVYAHAVDTVVTGHLSLAR